MARLFAALAILLTISGCASPLVLDQDGALAVIPHEIGASGQIVVETMLNGEGPFRLALDTGASISAIFEDARSAAGIQPAGGEMVHVQGISGTGFFPIARVREIAVGSETWANARVALLPESPSISAHVDGILGVDFLSRYAIWYSQRERVVRLYPREVVAERSYLGWNHIPLFNMRVGTGDVTTLALEMFIDGKRIQALFDLGATVNLMNRRAARALDVPVRRPRYIPDVWGVTGKTEVLVELVVWRLQIEHMQWTRRSFLIGDFPVFEALRINNRPAAIAGAGFFKDRDFIIDFSRKRLLVRSGR